MVTQNKVDTGTSDKALSEIVQGYWRLDSWGMTAQERLAFLEQHIELGITTVDHADIYGGYRNEMLFGEALAIKPAIREQIQIVTKCDIKLISPNRPNHQIKYYDTSAEHIAQSVESSLKNLGIEQIDLLLLHRPDILMDADEVAESFTRLYDSGKVKQFGVSNFLPRQYELLQSRLSQPLVTNQVEINPLALEVTENGTLEQMQQLKVRPMAWSCLAGGRLFNEQSEQIRRVVTELERIREEIGATTIEQVVYAWIRRLPSKPRPILGSGNIKRVEQATAALELDLTREQWYRIWQASKGHEVA